MCAAGIAVDDVGAGPPVLLLHGQPGLAVHMAPITEHLGGRVRALVPDRPGYGRSPGPPGTMAEQAQRFVELLEERSLGPTVIAAHSYGGGIAIFMAARRPDLVAGLVLVGSVGGEGSIAWVDHALAARIAGPVSSIASLAAYGALAPLLARLAPSSSLAMNVPDEPTLSLVRPWRTFLAEQRTLLDEEHDLSAAIGEVDCPVIVLQGRQDSVVPLAAGEDLAWRFSDAQLIVLERCGHLVGRDDPAAIASAVVSLTP